MLGKTGPGTVDVPGTTGPVCLGPAPMTPPGGGTVCTNTGTVITSAFEGTVCAKAGAATAAANAAMTSSLIIRVTPPFNEPRALRKLLVRRSGAFRELFRYLNLTSSAHAEASPRPKPGSCTKGRQKTAQQHKATITTFSHWVTGAEEVVECEDRVLTTEPAPTNSNSTSTNSTIAITAAPPDTA